MADLVRSVNSDVNFSDAELSSIIDNVWGAYGMFVTDKVGRAAAQRRLGWGRLAWPGAAWSCSCT